MAEKPHQQQVETAPDPDEDDLDDLDDVLDSFQSTNTSNKPSTSQPSSSTAPSTSGPGKPEQDAQKAQIIDPGEEDFQANLQKGMQGLISELDDNPEMQKQFEQMMQELIAAGAAPSDQEAGKHLREAAQAVPSASRTSEDRKSGPAPKKDDFNDTIRRTMERMQQSDASATSGAQSSVQPEEDMIAQMLKDLQGGEGGEEDFNKMLLQMMSQLTNKEILYDPMKELHEKFPGWMVANAEKAGKEDLERYKEQQKLVGQIVGRFERSGYSDENEEDRDYIVDKMQKMQAAGSPPPDLVGNMNAAQEALGDLDQGCPTQ